MLIESGVVRRTTPRNVTDAASCSPPLKTMNRVSGIISRVGFDDRYEVDPFGRELGAIAGVC